MLKQIVGIISQNLFLTSYTLNCSQYFIDMIIVIGATSFIGVHTVTELLNQGCKVLVTGRKNRFKEHYDALGVEYVNLDLNNEADFELLG